MDEGYSRLAFAIIERAIVDWRKSKNAIIHNCYDYEDQKRFISAEAFFTGDLIKIYLQGLMEPEDILAQLDKIKRLP